MRLVVVGLLCLILLLGFLYLYLDGKSSRVNKRVEAIAPKVAEKQTISVFRPAPRSTWRAHLARLLNLPMHHEGKSVYVMIIGILVAMGAAYVGHLLFPVWVAIIEGATVGCLAIRGIFGWFQYRYSDKILRQLPDVIQIVVSGVRAGLPVTEAFRTIANELPAPTKEQFGLVVSDLGLGKHADDALRGVFTRTGVREYAMFATTIAVQTKSGGRLAETLQTFGDSMRERVALAGRAKALASEAKLSMQVMAVLPFLAGTAVYFENHDSITTLFTDPRGHVFLGYGLTSLAIGITLMRRMIKKATTV